MILCQLKSSYMNSCETLSINYKHKPFRYQEEATADILMLK